MPSLSFMHRTVRQRSASWLSFAKLPALQDEKSWINSPHFDPPEMKKIPLIVGAALITLVLIFFYSGKLRNEVSAESTRNSNPETRHRPSLTNIDLVSQAPLASRNPRIKNAPDSEIEKLKRELHLAKAELDHLNRPLNEDMLSSTVKAEISPGDTLVSGGYKKEDGNYEITLITPSSVTLSDGTEGIEIQSKVITSGADFVNENGLESLATNAKNTLQHGESWTDEEVRSKITSAFNYKGLELMSFSILVRPSETFGRSITNRDGSQFAIRGKVAKNADGKFSIQSRIERTPETAQVTPSVDH